MQNGNIGSYGSCSFTINMTVVGKPPVFGTPSPVNGSKGNQLSLTWSIPINDPEGGKFSWTIQCNNGQNSNSTGDETNGIKSLVISGLTYSKSYTVWVNATDQNGSGLNVQQMVYLYYKEKWK